MAMQILAQLKHHEEHSFRVTIVTVLHTHTAPKLSHQQTIFL
jgi:hypothetical protein